LVSLVPEPKAAPAATPPLANPAAAEARGDYEIAERVGTVEAWDFFLAAHESGFYANLARAQRAKLIAAKVAANAPDNPSSPSSVQSAVPQNPLPSMHVATLPPSAPAEGTAKPQPVPAAPPENIAKLLQESLKRLGCDPGATNGRWDERSQRALARFNESVGTKLDIKTASLAALETVRSQTERVCPLECEHGMRQAGDRCVRITCDRGYALGSDGTCRRHAERPPREAKSQARAPSRTGPSRQGHCLSFGGRQICE
jgi:hypothetical protein